MKKHENKIAVITGGNSGIGYGIAEELIAQRTKVVITGKNQIALKKQNLHWVLILQSLLLLRPAFLILINS